MKNWFTIISLGIVTLVGCGCVGPNVRMTGVIPQMAAGSTDGQVSQAQMSGKLPDKPSVTYRLGVRRDNVLVINFSKYTLFLTRNGFPATYTGKDAVTGMKGYYYVAVHPGGQDYVDVGLGRYDGEQALIGADAYEQVNGQWVKVGMVRPYAYWASSWAPQTYYREIRDWDVERFR